MAGYRTDEENSNERVEFLGMKHKSVEKVKLI